MTTFNTKGDLNNVQQRLRTDASISLLVNNAGVAPVGTLAGLIRASWSLSRR
jgi:short-subunit dehydrogenase